MEQLKERISKITFKGIIAVALIFALIGCILFLERSGIDYRQNGHTLSSLPNEKVVFRTEAIKDLPITTLLLWDSSNKISSGAYDQFDIMLGDMKVGFDPVDVSKTAIPNFSNYEIVIVLMSDITQMGESVLDLTDWVYGGGSALFPVVLEKAPFTSAIENKLGIEESSYDDTVVESIYIDSDFMVGAGKSFNIIGGYDSAWAIQLNKKTTRVYAYTDDERKLPIVWKANYGKGEFAVDNLGLYEKNLRGIYVASYSLLTDVGVYPVINGSAFYLDDFPSQIPSGDNYYIKKDYGTSIRDFYVNIWWPDMMNFADKYGLRYTGLAIASYDDITNGETTSTPDKGTFLNFGNMLLRMGGEIGYHGYNHQPLCLDNCDYKGLYDYKTWDSVDAMKKSFTALVNLCDELFPGIHIDLYVPPSNILSEEGEQALLSSFPNIKTISGIYFKDDDLDFSCTQEFDVVSPGIVHQPRILSGCKLTSFMELAALSELNFHYVNSHFAHPDDALDPDRGAELGWEKLKKYFDEYLSWLYSSAKGIRNFTSTEMVAAVQRYVALRYTKEITKKEMTLKIENFYDEGYFMLRFNDKKLGKIKGGELTHITGNLYLMKATSDIVKISFA